MTYDAYESSTQDGSPVELIEFDYGGEWYGYTTSETDTVYNSKTYAALPWRREALQGTSDNNKAPMLIEFFDTVPVAEIFALMPPPTPVSVTLRRFHLNDNQYIVLFKGRVTNVAWTSDSVVKFTCESIITSIRRTGLRRMFQKSCPHQLYSQGVGRCNANPDTLKRTALAGNFTLSGKTIFSTAFSAASDNYFAGGFIQYFDPATLTNEFRFVRSSLANGTLTLSLPATAAAAAAAVEAFPGCNHTMTDCKTKFSNLPNFGGMPYIPTENPFGNSIY